MWDLAEHSSGSRAKGTKEAEGSDGKGGVRGSFERWIEMAEGGRRARDFGGVYSKMREKL